MKPLFLLIVVVGLLGIFLAGCFLWGYYQEEYGKIIDEPSSDETALEVPSFPDGTQPQDDQNPDMGDDGVDDVFQDTDVIPPMMPS